MEQNLLSDFYIKRTPRSILEKQGTFHNNPYCFAIMKGLVEDVDSSWKVENEETIFVSDELKEDFLNVLKFFFSNKYLNGEPDMTGTIDNGVTDLTLTTPDLALEAKGKVSVERTFWTSSSETYPVQFLVNAEDLLLDTDTSFKLKDLVWFCLRPGGFLLSLDAEQFGVLVTLFEDVIKRQSNKSFEDKVKEMYRPTMQENIFTAFASFYKYLKETGALETSYFRF